MIPARVLFVHWGEEGIRGSERVLLDLLGNLDRESFEPVLWCNAETMAAAARRLDVVVHVSAMPILLGWDAPRFNIGAYGKLIRRGGNFIREHGVRLVHANSGAPNQWMVPAARNARVPLVAHLHAIYGLRDRSTMLIQQAPMIVGCSDAVVRPFRSDGVPDSRLRVIPNGVDLTRLNIGDARSLRASLGISTDAVLAVGAGALVPLKGFDVAIRALPLVRETGVSVHLAIAGEGPELATLSALASELGVRERVHFLGQQANLGAIFRDAANVAAISSRIESFGLVAVEAGAVGVTSVATRVGGIPEIIEDGKTGLLVPVGDHSAFASALVRLAKDARLREKLGEEARARVIASYTIERTTSRFEQLYTQMIARPSSDFGWSRQGFSVTPLGRSAMAIVRRRLGMRVGDA